MGDPEKTQPPGPSDVGACFIDGELRFRVWAPRARKVAVKIVSTGQETVLPMSGDYFGYFSAVTDAATEGSRYVYILDGNHQYPDPASRFQPEGVHGPSEVVDPCSFEWHDTAWKGIPLRDLIIYELHTGTFTGDGTFEAVIPMLDYLAELGINALELMPVSQFPGGRNWGYDGVYPFAPQNTYGGPMGLMSLIDACHARGLAVILDVVYNHLGPEGNYLNQYGYYFTDRYRTPWGDALNFDGPYSDEVRRFFISNAIYWLAEYHADALRLDAVHGISDLSARPFLRELSDAVHELRNRTGRDMFIIAESDLNDARIIDPAASCGYNLDAQWNDDFHHALHALLTNETNGYYQDFGAMAHLEKAFREGFVYSGQYSGFRKRRHGSSVKDRPPHQFVAFSQNHDQVGNRPGGDRLSRSLSFEKLKLAAGLVILSPYLPLLFMGEEYGETAPFRYFVSFIDDDLAHSVGKGRRGEFASAGWKDAIVEPQSERAFLDSKLHLELRQETPHSLLLDFYMELIRLRKTLLPLRNLDRSSVTVLGMETEEVLLVTRRSGREELFCLFNLGEGGNLKVPLPSGTWRIMLDSSSVRWGGERTGAFDNLEAGAGDTVTPMHARSFMICQRGYDE